MLLEGSTHSGKLAPCHLSALMPPSTVIHDCPNTVFGEFCTATLLVRQCHDFMEGGFHCFELRFRRSLGERPNASVSHLRSTDVFHWRLLPNGSLSGLDCASWTMGESCAVTCAEGYQAANGTRGTLTCAYDEVAGHVVLEVAVPKCLSVVCSLDDPSTGVTHECHDILSQGSCVALSPVEYEADGNISTTSLRCCSSDEFVSEARTVYPSCPQMLGSHTLIQSGVGVNSTCGGASIGDRCLVFCAEGARPNQFHRQKGTKTCVARDDEQNKGTLPMPTFATRPSTMSSTIPVDIPQNSMVGQQRQEISEMQFDKFPSLYSCFLLGDKVQK